MKILVIQTAFTGDVILATPVLEELHRIEPGAEISILVRNGNEGLFTHHPFLKEVLIWDKKKNKYLHLLQLRRKIRSEKFSVIVNLHRFGSSGFLTAFSGAEEKYGFDKNPFSPFFTRTVKHVIGNNKHETQRNLELISHLGASLSARPVLYPHLTNEEKTRSLKTAPYICMAPASVWFTKQFPVIRWQELIRKLKQDYRIYLIGAPSDLELCEKIRNENNDVINLCGKLDFLDSASLMRDAVMNYTNDSAPMHIASSVNAAVTAIYCSTVPAFGFGPLSDQSRILQIPTQLYCRPCGLHGRKKCPEDHFRCAMEIPLEDECREKFHEHKNS